MPDMSWLGRVHVSTLPGNADGSTAGSHLFRIVYPLGAHYCVIRTMYGEGFPRSLPPFPRLMSYRGRRPIFACTVGQSRRASVNSSPEPPRPMEGEAHDRPTVVGVGTAGVFFFPFRLWPHLLRPRQAHSSAAFYSWISPFGLRRFCWPRSCRAGKRSPGIKGPWRHLSIWRGQSTCRRASTAGGARI